MNWASGEVVGVLTFLLPGFVAAAVFYSLTSHPKPDAFDRIVQALIFTVIGNAITTVFLSSGSSPDEYAEWLKNWEPVVSILVAVALALMASYASNRDSVHRILRRINVTRETSHPSEWYSAFSRHGDCYVVLHLKGQRRLYGWPEEWPAIRKMVISELRKENGWMTINGYRQKGVAAILIPASEVEMVEFLSGTT